MVSEKARKKIGLLAGVVAGVAVTLYVAHEFTLPKTLCDGAPFIYATFHDEVGNVVKYSRNGCRLQDNVLDGFPKFNNPAHFVETRGIVLGQYLGQPALYVADAFSEDSYLNVYGDCNAEGRRPLLTVAISTVMNPGTDHIYGIAFDQDHNLYISNQHTDNVQRFYKDTFEPMPLPHALPEGASPPNFPGTFYQYGAANIHPINNQGVRDIAALGGYIYIANEDINGVSIVNAATGVVEDIVPILSPIGLHHNHLHNWIFVSSKAQHFKGHVYAISIKKRQVVRTYHSKHMTHPTGLTTHAGILYVANQKSGEIVTFNINDGKYLKTIVSNMPPGIEQITLSPC